MRVLGLIPARGGSQGVPGKNIKLLAGKPLLAYTAEAALAARRLARVILSTDDPAIAAVGRDCGLDVPFLRPAELARADTPTLPVVLHALAWAEAHDAAHTASYDAICLLQPTTPLRPAGEIDACIALLESSGAESVITVLPVPHEYNPHWVYVEDAAGQLRLSTGEPEPIPRRQALPPAYHRSGSVYVTRWAVAAGGSLYGRSTRAVIGDPALSVNINTPEDWARAEALLRGGSP